MKPPFIVTLSVLALFVLGCGALNFPAQPQTNPKLFSGSITIQGSGVIIPCKTIPDISCTGKTTVTVLPGPDDFQLDTDQSGHITAGQAKLDLEVNQNYDITTPDSPGCSGQLLGTSTSSYTGAIPLPAVGGPPITSAIFYGPLAENGNGVAPWQCEGQAGAPSGSAKLTADNVSLELEGFSPSMKHGDGGKCTFSVMPQFNTFLTGFASTCTYTIEEVLPLMAVPTRSP